MGAKMTDGLEEPLDTELQQVNLRLPRRRVDQARRLASSRRISLPQYIDQLILDDVEQQKDTLLRKYTQEEEQARRAREEMLRELAAR
jgi:hypothetical protein